MKTVTLTYTLYTLAELRDLADDPDSNITHDAYERAHSWVLEGNTDYEWWDSIEWDLSEIGLNLDSFDIDRRSIQLSKVVGCWWNVARKVLTNHGKDAQTYRIVRDYIRLAVDARRTWYDALPPDERATTDRSEWESTDDAKTLLADFVNDLGEEYLSLLQQELDYRTSEEAVFETAEANEYHFTLDGHPA